MQTLLCRQKKKINFKDHLILARILCKPCWECPNNLIQFPREHFVLGKVGYTIFLCLYVCMFLFSVREYLRLKFWLKIEIIYLLTYYKHKSQNGTWLKENQISSYLLGRYFFHSCSLERNNKLCCFFSFMCKKAYMMLKHI